ncbi:hypothetical protein LDENG_00047640 [Lucifuga dentata]|nr:hypothetical protein LDENG_00047640 [Lucifuga dentata]
MSDKTIPSTSQWSKEKVTSSSSSVQEAGNIPMKDKNEINGSVLPVSTAFSGRGHSSRKVKQPESQHLLMEVGKEAVQSSTQVPSAVETTKTPLIESPEEPASQLRATSSNKILSIMEAAKMPVRKLDKLNVTSPPVSTASLSTEHSLEKEKLSETQQQKEEEAIPSPSIRGLSASETCNAPSTKAPQAGLVQPKEHHTSHASLQDALLFVEAMSAQTLGYESVKNASSQTQNASHLVTLKADTEVPAKLPNSLLPQTPGSPITAKITIRTHQAAGNEPTIKQATTSKSTAPIFSAGSQTTVVSPTNVAQAHKKRVVIPFTATATPMTSTVITQKSVTFQQCLASRNIKVVAPSKAPRNTSSQNIIIVPRHLSSVSPHTVSPLSETQLASIVSTVASRKYSLSPASKAAGLAMPSLSSVPLKTIVVASKQSLPIVTSHTTATSTLAHPKFKILVPRQVPVEASRQQLSSLPQKTILTRRQEPVETAPSVAVSLAQPVSSSQQPSISVDSQTISGEKTTTLPQQKENISENSESHKQTASVTKTTNVLTETRLNSESSFSPELVQTSVSPAVPPTSQSQPKLSAVIKLTRLPFSLTAKESVLVQKTLKGSTEVLSFVRNSPNVSTISVTTHEKPSLVKSTKSSLTRPNSQACQLSEKPNDIQTCQLSEKPNNLKEKTVKNTHLFSAVSERKSAPTESPAAFLDTPVSEMSITSCDSSLDLDSNKDFVKHNNPLGTQEKSSDLPIRLTSIISKDTSDAHAQMSKIQFLAQLAVSPVDQVQQEAFSSDAVDARAASAETSTNDSTPLQKDSLVARLRNHLKTCLRPEKPEPLKETEAPVNSKRPRLADVVTDSPTQSALTDNVASFKDTTKDSNSISPRISRLCKGGVRSKKIVSRASSVSPRRSSLTKDSASPKKTATSVSPRRRDLTRAGASPNKITSESTAVGLRRSSTRNDAKAKIKCEADSPSAKSSRFANDGIRPKKTKESTPAMKPKLIQDATNSKKSLKVANAKKLAKAEKSKLTTLRKSKQKLQQKIQLRESNTNCETVKKCKSKAVWTPPRIPVNTSPQTKGSSLSPIPAKSERSQNTGQSSTPTNRSQIVKSKGTQSSPCTVVFPPSVSLHPIPVKAPPIVSPLQPLSVIGRRLLRNQCGECGRVLSSPAALESHVSLHTGHRPFSCTLCGKGFPDSKGLKRHGRVHRNGRIHICPQCGKGFVYRFSLTKHIQMVHNRMKPFPCPVCNKGFFTKRDVEGHVRMHTGEKPFHCNLCEKKFARRVELNMHLRWHNGEKRHWCPYCGKGFLDSNNLKRHKYIHTGERPHACPHCSKHFTQSGHLKKHLKNVHKVE